MSSFRVEGVLEPLDPAVAHDDDVEAHAAMAQLAMALQEQRGGGRDAPLLGRADAGRGAAVAVARAGAHLCDHQQVAGTRHDVEHGLVFQPKFDADGLIPAIVTDASTGGVLMFAWMNAEALALTMATRAGHFWSRSRGSLWKKGETSGNVLDVAEILTDCDQDVVWLKVRVQGDGVACHTGARSCFYRALPLGVKPSPRTVLRPV